MANELYELAEFLSDLFGIPQNWLTGPQLVINLVIPFMLIWAAFYVVLTNKLKFFKRSGLARGIISFMLAFFSLPLTLFLSQFVAIPGSVFIIVMLSGRRITLKRLILALFLSVLSFYTSVWISNMLAEAWPI